MPSHRWFRYVRTILVAFGAIVLFVIGGCGRDARIPAMHLIQVTRTEAAQLPGQNVPAHADTTETWLAADRVRREGPQQTFVLRADTGTVLLLDRKNRTYLNLTFDEASHLLSQLAAVADTTDSRTPRTRQLTEMVRVSARVVDTGDDETINGYHCHRYIVEIRMGDATTTTEQWVTRDLKVDLGLLRRASFATLVGLPGGAAAMAELAKVQGLPVRATTIIDVFHRQVRSTTDLVAAQERRVSPKLFEPPPGYIANEAGS